MQKLISLLSCNQRALDGSAAELEISIGNVVVVVDHG